MVFCPTARGLCQGRANCKLWIRGRILYTDSKLLAAQLAWLILKEVNPSSSPTITPKARELFWQNQGIPNIQHEIIVDRYLREKVAEVEALAQAWIPSPGFQYTISDDKSTKTKESSALHKPRCKSLH